ncbi:ParB/RepB/Spo0J family partition protein [Bacteriovorax sp. PP10]|uniref:ParB/RepB/Spo0J family partition protein n=1 Tax=Bacteriovorax antarcticus TaxID=3088717 RepID=A0ABU5VS04_9BACT|nr:ParB/RepB/Spo0J family partition protein [Bacteriovorax sp. PP10]MEA9354800.1 ParB/RepB/Spo0J family partition protein [Bacteriovorax sp. PP10]
MAKKLALGKGIASLLHDATPNTVVNQTYNSHYGNPQEHAPAAPVEKEIEIRYENTPLLVNVGSIKTNPNQPRKIFKEKDLDELAESIRENGIIQPLIVAELENGEYELVAGERRLRASKKIGLEQVPVVVKRATDREKMIMSIIENVQRSDLNCVEEALAYYQLMNEYKLTQEDVAKKLGKERSTVANFLRVLNLPRPVIDLLQKEMLSFGHAKILAAVKEREDATRLANEAVAKSWSVRELEQAIKAKKPLKEKAGRTNPFFEEKLDQFRKTLEQKTGYHFALSSGKNGSGQISLKYSNEAEFNDIYEFLLSK